MNVIIETKICKNLETDEVSCDTRVNPIKSVRGQTDRETFYDRVNEYVLILAKTRPEHFDYKRNSGEDIVTMTKSIDGFSSIYIFTYRESF